MIYIYTHPPTCGCLHVGNIPFSPWWIMPASPGYEANFWGWKWMIKPVPHDAYWWYTIYIMLCVYTYTYIYILIYIIYIWICYPPQTYLFNMFLASFPYHGSTAVDRWTLDRCVVRKKSCCLRLVRTNFCWKQQCLDFQCTMLVNKNMFPTLFPLFTWTVPVKENRFLWISKTTFWKGRHFYSEGIPAIFK